MDNISGKFIRVAVIFALVGMALGIKMAISGVHDQTQAHAHINLLGWVTMMLYGLFYRSHENAGQSRLALAHFWLSTLGAIVINVGVYLIYSDVPEGDPVAAVGSIATILGMATFAVIVFKNTGSDKPR
ncbi:MAG: cytochrome-c oxidase [Rhodospirillales bacterium]|jgi:cbb3-type cytochrome oxidase subunit 1|nr:cytochrome-c oxidase [Rhodospirillaceae bacterium]MBT3556444.1 cytochrome-c oxidase [Rhodospirillales bacterium]MBT4039293.1 cytochrome-c oxidase [Rhodospirillales bacterium]MBT4628245.1 cytochrome-c oxidase [Rhodospirillales bacterium]MBT5351994.1 cytochrome-c oxidase [Rhodospirillales bacterium]